ncbi:Chorismate mutase 2 [Ranunculus cassubicifolius]
MADSTGELNLQSIRDSLIRQEDTIIFSLIERARFPINSPAYDSSQIGGSVLDYIVKETEIIQAKAGRYTNPEEHPFFPDDLPPPIFPPRQYPQVLHPVAASININKTIWKFYLEEFLPLFVSEGDDGNYGSTVECDLQCLQALSRRIHYGKFVAEVKFRDDPQDYGTFIQTQDRDALMKLLTFEAVEEAVKRRVEKKASVFGQEVTLDDKGSEGKYKVDPAVVSRLYGEWVMPLTKLVQVEYLLRRLDD